jgi:hypothetical protein
MDENLERRAQEELNWSEQQIARARKIDIQQALLQNITTKKPNREVVITLQRKHDVEAVSSPPPPPPSQKDDIATQVMDLVSKILILNDRIGRKQQLAQETDFLSVSDRVLLDGSICRNQQLLVTYQTEQGRLEKHISSMIVRKQQVLDILAEDDDVDLSAISTITANISMLTQLLKK